MKMDALNLEQALNLTINSMKITRTSSSKMRKRSTSERDGDRVSEGDDLVSEEGSNINNESSIPRMKRVAHKSPTRKSSRIAQESRDANNVRDGNNVNEEFTDPKMKKVAYGPTRKSSRILQNMKDVIARGKGQWIPNWNLVLWKMFCAALGQHLSVMRITMMIRYIMRQRILWRVVLLVGMVESPPSHGKIGITE
ncbi:trichohyalin-like [Iris pallida]|uniref:Trichohyalin-like n=1 Tax=Iris pallida TaxID=29817 RepID=A0AAX6DTW2_IRIPA|nr:trichohyalin-like [Iris pallida]